MAVAMLVLLAACDQAPTQMAQKGHSSFIADYQTARSVLWRSLYPDGGHTLYCSQQFEGGYHKGIIVEHVFPMSWVTNALACGTRIQCRNNSDIFNQIEADLHNLYPARSDVNQDRSSFRFGEVAGEARHYGHSCDFEVSERTRTAEPAPAVRGQVARAMFYMAYKYRDQGLIIFASQGRLLNLWHQTDPPGEPERIRNRHIERLQGNRNPFIDKPEQLSALVASDFFY